MQTIKSSLIIDRKISIFEEEGIVFKTNCTVGTDIEVNEILPHYDAVLLCGGATVPRDLPIEGHEAALAVDKYLMKKDGILNVKQKEPFLFKKPY